ncbi:MAG: DUF1343 domain-containing protein, partial [Acidobacteriota bacterium]
TLDTAVVYPGMVLIEGTRLSEGRGTTRPFELVGAPFIDGRRLAAHLNDLALPGARFRPVAFEPTFQKHARTLCGGVQLHVTDRSVFEPYLGGVLVITAVRALYPEKFSWLAPPYEYEYEKLPIEILCGSRQVIQGMESGATPESFRALWQEDAALFRTRRTPYLLYD